MSKMKSRRRVLRVLLTLLLGAMIGMTGRSMRAQNNYGAVVGTITDATGADIPGAIVTLKSVATNATLTTKSGSGGTYNFLNLNPGTYSVSVTNPGFKAVTNNQVDVTIGGSTRIDVALPVGDVGQSVMVSAGSAAALQTDAASLGGVIEGAQVVDSPLNGRDVNNLLDFVPGVVPGGGTSGSTVSNQSGGQTQAIAYGNYQIGGGFSGLSLFYIDGVESNIPENNVNALVPTQDAVQEFRVATNNVSAEFGLFGGGVVEISTKSGTNQFHGSAYEYFRNTVLDANDWFSNHTGLSRPPLNQNQSGVNIGGPIFKNKAFFFFSWERESLNAGSFLTATVPTAAELSGNFSAISTPIYDPATGKQFDCNGVLNVICPTGTGTGSTIDPSASAILTAESPAPNQPGLVNNFITTKHTEGLQNQFNARVDYKLGSADSLFARYSFWNPHNGPSDPFGNLTGNGVTGNTTTEGVLGDNHIFNQSTVAEIRYSYLQNYNFQTPLSNGYDMSKLGANYGTIQNNSENKQGLLPALTIPGFPSITAENSQLYWLNNIYSLTGSVTKIVGRHTIKFGGDWRSMTWPAYSDSQGIVFTGNQSFTANPSVANSGNALASFLIGLPVSSSTEQVAETVAFMHQYGFYGTDTFQVNNKLTLNLGLRWDQPGAYSEKHNLDAILQPNAANPLGTIINPVAGPGQTPASQTLMADLALVDSPQYPSRREESLHWDLFSPRVGLDYRAFNKTVLRMGYGISYLPANETQDGPQISSINYIETSLSNSVGVTPATAATTTSNPFPTGFLFPTGRSPQSLPDLYGQTISGRIPNQPYGYVQQYNVAVERQIDNKSTLTVAFAGSKGTHLVLSDGYTESGQNLNQLPDVYDSLGGALTNSVANPFFGVLPAGTLGDATILEGNLLKPYPEYQDVNQTVPRDASSTYNALQASYRRQFSHGGVVQVAYTWAKLLSNTDNTSSFLDLPTCCAGVPQDYTNLRAEKSLSLQNLAQNLVINYGVDLPFGRGEKFLAGTNGAVNAIVGGWRVNGITTIHSGTPVPITAAPNALSEYFGAGTVRPNLVSVCSRKINGSAETKVAEWFNTACFTQPADFTFGNENRVDSVITSAGAANYDFSASKTARVTQQLNLIFSAEIFNLFNRVQFAPPDGSMTDATYGQSLSQENNPREVQFALRLKF